MNKVKIQALILLSAILFGFAGCADGSSGGNAVIPSTDNVKYPSAIDITTQDAFVNSEGVIDQNAVDDWESYMSDLYKTTVTLNSFNTSKPVYVLQDIMAGKLTGMVDALPYTVLTLGKSGDILPLEEYLADNKVWNSLPEDYRKQFEIDGHIWAISKSTTDYLRVTSIRTDWLKAVGKEMPTTQAELFEVGKVFANGNPDGDNNAANNYLFGYANARWIDVLSSFGVYVNVNHVFSISYDPTMDCIVDGMFKPEAKAALQYLKDMYQAGMIDYNSFSNTTQVNSNNTNGLYGSYFGRVTTGKYNAGINWAENNAQTVLGRTLDLSKAEDAAFATGIYEAMPPLSTKYPLCYASAVNGYVLAKGTKDPKAVVNAFVDMLFGSAKNYLNCYYGKPESYTDKGGNVYVANMDKTTGKASPRASIINAPEVIFQDNYAFINDGNYSEQAVQTAKNKVKYISDYIDKYADKIVQRPVLYDISGDSSDETQISSIANSFTRLMLTIANKDVTVDQALEEYRSNVKLYQIDELLKTCNENIGKTSKQVIE